jgi:energy-coupling factor transport system permease protein
VALLALLAAVHIILLTSRVPAGQIAWVWRQLRRVLVIIVVMFPLFSRLPGPVLFELGPLTVTWAGVLAGLATAIRVIGMSLLFFVILFTTRQNELVRGLVRLGLPFEWGLTLSIALRYIPSFGHAIAQIQEAQAARGWQVERGDLWGRLRGVAPVLVALIIDVLRTGDTLGMTLAARGVGAGQPRTVWREIHMGRGDWLALTLIAALLVVALYARFALGLGADLLGGLFLLGPVS